jgi:hypothetical protein
VLEPANFNLFAAYIGIDAEFVERELPIAQQQAAFVAGNVQIVFSARLCPLG